jgi:hypothetical protein
LALWWEKEIRQATASELLTLDEEYSMQESWRRDADKLTFIVCPPSLLANERNETSKQLSEKVAVSPDSMIGDVNLFLRLEDKEPTQDNAIAEHRHEPKKQFVGELELMIAEKTQRRQGFGRAALLCFLKYILEHKSSIVEEFLTQTPPIKPSMVGEWSSICVKIDQNNKKSLALFESLGFAKIADKANVFGELELRRNSLEDHWIQGMLEKYRIRDYSEALCQRKSA